MPISRDPFPEALLFDLDGTLTDSSPGFIATMRHMLGALGLTAPDDAVLRSHIGPPIQATILRLVGAAGLDEGMRIYRERYSAIGLYENAVYPGIEAALVECRARGAQRLFVATSKPRAFALRILEHFGLLPGFEAVYGSELDGSQADKATLIANLLRRDSVDPRASIMIGDRVHDAHGAQANGVRMIGALWGFGTRLELEQAGVAALCERPEDLVETLSRLASMPAK